MAHLWRFCELFAYYELLIALQHCYAGLDGFWSKPQMALRHHTLDGYPLLQHAGIWYDAVAVTPLIAWMVAWHDLELSSIRSMIVMAISLGIWLGLTLAFTKLPLPEAHVHDGKTTAAGWIHFGYATAATWTVVNFYFSHPSRTDLLIETLVMTPWCFFGIWKINKRLWHWNAAAKIQTIAGPVVLWTIFAVFWRFNLFGK